MLCCDADEVLFVSCGSEADNHAIRSAVAVGRAQLDALPHVVTSCIEHPAILACLDALERGGDVSVTRVGANVEGLVEADAVAAALEFNTVLVTVMHSQNELGAVNPIAAIVEAVDAAHRAGRTALRAVVHTDAAQSCGKVAVNVRALGVDLCTVALCIYSKRSLAARSAGSETRNTPCQISLVCPCQTHSSRRR